MNWERRTEQRRKQNLEELERRQRNLERDAQRNKQVQNQVNHNHVNEINQRE